MDEIIKEYWLRSPNNYPKVFTMAKIFGVSPEKICDILFEKFDKAEFSDKIVYFKANSFKTFDNSSTFVLNYMNKLTNYSRLTAKPYQLVIEDMGKITVIEKETDKNEYLNCPF